VSNRELSLFNTINQPLGHLLPRLGLLRNLDFLAVEAAGGGVVALAAVPECYQIGSSEVE